MDLFTRAVIRELLAERETPCLSLFFPRLPRGGDANGSPVRIAGLAGEAERRLMEWDIPMLSILEMLNTVRALEENASFTGPRDWGLVIFISPCRAATFRLPIDFGPTAVVEPYFHIRPLTKMLSDDGSFYVLALERGGFQLFHGSRDELDEIDIARASEIMPGDARRASLETGQSDAHEYQRKSPGRGSAFAGEAEVKDLSLFLRGVDAHVCALLDGERAPLVLAGTDQLTRLYIKTSGYQYIAGPVIDHEPENCRPVQLHRMAWQVAGPLLSRRRREAVDRHRGLAGRGDPRAASQIDRVLPAACSGGVGALFLNHQGELWGKVDPGSGCVEAHGERQPRDEDLVNTAVVHTLFHDGEIFTSGAAEFFQGRPLAATLRYP